MVLNFQQPMTPKFGGFEAGRQIGQAVGQIPGILQSEKIKADLSRLMGTPEFQNQTATQKMQQIRQVMPAETQVAGIQQQAQAEQKALDERRKNKIKIYTDFASERADDQDALDSLLSLAKKDSDVSDVFESFTGIKAVSPDNDVPEITQTVTVTDENLPEYRDVGITAPGSFNITRDIGGKLVSVKPAKPSLAEEMGDIEKTKLLSNKVDKLIGGDTFKKGKAKLSAARNVRKLYVQARNGNQNALNILKTQIPRLAGEVGNLAKAEQESSIGGISLARKMKDTTNKFLSGKVSEAAFDDLNNILNVFEGSAQKDINKIINQTKSSVAGLGIDEERIKAVIDPYLETESVGDDEVKKTDYGEFKRNPDGTWSRI